MSHTYRDNKTRPKKRVKKQTERAGGNGAIHEGKNVYALKYTCTLMCFLEKKNPLIFCSSDVLFYKQIYKVYKV